MIAAAKPVIAATAPAAVGITLAQVNAILGAVSLAVGIAYHLWKWRREAKQRPQS